MLAQRVGLMRKGELNYCLTFYNPIVLSQRVGNSILDLWLTVGKESSLCVWDKSSCGVSQRYGWHSISQSISIFALVWDHVLTTSSTRSWHRLSLDSGWHAAGSWCQVNIILYSDSSCLCNDEKQVIPVSQNRGENYYGNYWKKLEHSNLNRYLFFSTFEIFLFRSNCKPLRLSVLCRRR